MINVDAGTDVGNIVLDQASGVLSGSAILVNLSGRLGALELVKLRTIGGSGSGALVSVNSSATGLTRIALKDIDTDNIVVRNGSAKAVVAVSFKKVRSRSSSVSPFRTEGVSVLNVGGESLIAGRRPSVYHSSGGFGRLDGASLSGDLAAVRGSQPGDRFLNTNGGLTSGAGQVRTNGETWVNEQTGATFRGTPVAGRLILDTFARSDADVIDTVPDIGAVSYSGGRGEFAVKEGKLVAKGGLGLPVFLPVTASGGQITSLVWHLNSRPGKKGSDRILVNAFDASNCIQLSRGEDSAAEVKLSVVLEGATRELDSKRLAVVPPPVPRDYPVTIRLTGDGSATKVEAVVGSQVLSGQLSPNEAGALRLARMIGLASTSPDTMISNLQVDVDGFYV
ncbi:hypothetical protein QM583_21535 [Gordonia alkanivorans]|uniref:hypothetical protein n=1 Tax=Gordonia alkanivorans TaxID=84096 RepID=UPI0024B78CB1|nr:hypothetical protein [Gordonia alkanivorans]MDJ0029636.1 hypothetical protein [Gordonia alkanivorans]